MPSHVKLASNHNTRKICNMADVVQWHLRRVAACVLVLFYVNRRKRNRKRWRNRKFWTKLYTLYQQKFLPWSVQYSRPRASHRRCCLLVLSIFVRRRRNVPQIGTIVNFFDKTKRCVPFLKSVRHFAMITQNT